VISKAFAGSLAAVILMAGFAEAQVAAPREIKQQRGHQTYHRMKRARAGYTTPGSVAPVTGSPRFFDRVTPAGQSTPVYVRRTAPTLQQPIQQPGGQPVPQPMIAAPNSGAIQHSVARPVLSEPRTELQAGSTAPVTPQNSKTPAPSAVPQK